MTSRPRRNCLCGSSIHYFSVVRQPVRTFSYCGSMAQVYAGKVSGLFSKSAASYAKFRPNYPAELYEMILKHANLPSQGLAVDVATGSGQAAKGLSKYFTTVLALDHDSEQLKHAFDLPNVAFELATAEKTGLEDSSADLVAVAAGLHWFDLDMFYPEAHRILKPGGCLAAWGYDMLTFPDKHDAQDLLHRFSTVILAPYWNEKVKHVWHHYKDIEPDAALFQVRHLQLTLETTMTLSMVAGFISTWSAYNSYCQDRPNQPDPLVHFQEAFLDAAKLSSADEEFNASYPLFLMLCRSPH